ncbi:hypothetical protein Vafri_8310, partial [Volvox africanus]
MTCDGRRSSCDGSATRPASFGQSGKSCDHSAARAASSLHASPAPLLLPRPSAKPKVRPTPGTVGRPPLSDIPSPSSVPISSMSTSTPASTCSNTSTSGDKMHSGLCGDIGPTSPAATAGLRVLSAVGPPNRG